MGHEIGEAAVQTFADQRSATKTAVDLAYRSGKDGRPAQVML
jgi:hypothetical protein